MDNQQEVRAPSIQRPILHAVIQGLLFVLLAGVSIYSATGFARVGGGATFIIPILLGYSIVPMLELFALARILNRRTASVSLVISTCMVISALGMTSLASGALAGSFAGLGVVAILGIIFLALRAWQIIAYNRWLHVHPEPVRFELTMMVPPIVMGFIFFIAIGLATNKAQNNETDYWAQQATRQAECQKKYQADEKAKQQALATTPFEVTIATGESTLTINYRYLAQQNDENPIYNEIMLFTYVLPGNTQPEQGVVQVDGYGQAKIKAPTGTIINLTAVKGYGVVSAGGLSNHIEPQTYTLDQSKTVTVLADFKETDTCL